MDDVDDPFSVHFDQAPMRIDEQEFRILLSQLADPDSRMRRRAARQLAFSDDLRAFDALLPLLQDPVDDVREAALRSLARVNASRALPYVLHVLTHSRPDMRRVAAYELGALGDQRAYPLLERCLADPDEEVRCKALRSLSVLNPLRTLPAIVAALSDASSIVRWVASECLCDMDTLAELANAGVVDALLQALADEKGAVRLNAAEALGRLGDPRALEPLAWVAEHDEGEDGHGHEVRREAVEAIKAIYRGAGPATDQPNIDLS